MVGRVWGNKSAVFLSTVIKNWMVGEQELLSPKLALDIAIVDSSCYKLCCSQLKAGGTLDSATPLTTSEEINFLFCDHIQPCSAAFTSITSS